MWVRSDSDISVDALLRVVKSDPEFMAPVNFYAGKGCIFYAFFMTCAVPVIGNYSLKVTKRSN